MAEVAVYKTLAEAQTADAKKKKKWIQKAFRSIKRRGTAGKCTGKKFGGPSCPPGSKAYNMAKALRAMARKKKK